MADDINRDVAEPEGDEPHVQFFPTRDGKAYSTRGSSAQRGVSPWGAGYADGLREGTQLFSERLTELEEDVDLLKFVVKVAAITAVVIALALASRPLEEVRR